MKTNDELFRMSMERCKEYAIEDVAPILWTSDDILRASGVEFGTRRMPRSWMRAITWSDRVEDNLKKQAKRMDRLVMNGPTWGLAQVKIVMKGFDPARLSKWFTRAIRASNARYKIAARLL